MARDGVLVDTSAWIDFFRDRSPAADAVERLLAEGRALRCGPVDLALRHDVPLLTVDRDFGAVPGLRSWPLDAMPPGRFGRSP